MRFIHYLQIKRAKLFSKIQPASPTLGFAALLIITLLTPRLAFAAPAWEGALQTIVDYMTGTTARLLAILAVAGFGIAAFFGRISWRRAIEIGAGIAIVFGAAGIVDMLSGN